MSEWQPIETAPREKPVLVTDGEFCFVAQRVNIMGKGRDPTFCWYAMHGADTAESGDYGRSTMLEDHAWGKNPTHWMPLPEPPQ